jgi:HEXXH motif-containing protein
MLTTHRVSAEDLAELASGGGSARGALRAGQLSRRLLAIHTVVITAARLQPVAFDCSGVAGSYAALRDLHSRRRPAADDILMHPPVGAWAMHCLRQLVSPRPSPTSLAGDLAHLGNITASVAVGAGESCEVRVRVRDGNIMLPCYGLARLAAGTGWARLRVRDGKAEIVSADGGRTVVVTPQDPERSTWQPLRRLRSEIDGMRIGLVLDDLDPFRGFHRFAAVERLPAAEVTAWQSLLDDAWTLLVRHHRGRAEAIAAGLASLVPLRGDGARQEMSASSSEAFGAAALTRPRDGLAFAAALVHEFQHVKLSALLDLVPLHDMAPGPLFYAPWRTDPRPLKGLLQGAYAFLGVTDFWHAHRRHARGVDERIAQFECARWRGQVAVTLDIIQDSGALTEAGKWFVEGMRSRIDLLGERDVPDEQLALAADAAADHRAGWRLRHERPDATLVTRWADAWLRDRTGPTAPEAPSSEAPSPQEPAAVCQPDATTPGQARFRPSARLSLAYLRLREPALFDYLADHPAELARQVPGTTAADALLIGGDLFGAAQGYIEMIIADPGRLDAWAGLAAARSRLATLADDPLAAYPEQVYALAEELRQRTGAVADPAALADWLAKSDWLATSSA